jgi:Ca2+/H+ antiporter
MRHTLVDYYKNREKFSVPRILVRIDFFSDIAYLYLYIKLLPENNVTSQIAYYTIQTIFIAGATIFNFIRFSRNFYFSLFREMSETIYWTYVLLVLFLLRIPFIRSFASVIENPLFRILHLCFSVIILVQILITFQSRFWAKSNRAARQKRIKKLLKKAGLSNNEYEEIKPILVDSASLKEKPPLIWKILLLLFALIIAVTLSDSASDFLDLLAKTFSLPFSNILPPY